MAGTACRSGRTTCGRHSCCVSRGAASAHGKAAESERQTLTTSSRTTETGSALPTQATCKVCATVATAQRPWPKAGLKARRNGADRRNAWTGAGRWVCANLARNLKISRSPPTLGKFCGGAFLTAAPHSCEIFSQWSGNFGGFENGKQEKRRSGRAGRGKSGVVHAGTDGARADRGAGALCAKCEDTQREPDRADQSEPAGVWLCQSGNHRQRPKYHRRTRARAGGQGRGHDRGAVRAGRAPDGRTAPRVYSGGQPACGAVRLGHRDAGA